MKNKGVIIGGVLVLLLLIGGGFFVLSRNSQEPAPEEEIVEEELASLSPEEIGLELTANAAKNSVQFIINKPEGITAIEYELSYTADGPDGEIDRGVYGTIDDIDNSAPVESKFLDLGSCSSGTCKFDKGVEKVNLLLKVEKEGTTYQVEDSLEL